MHRQREEPAYFDFRPLHDGRKVRATTSNALVGCFFPRACEATWTAPLTARRPKRMPVACNKYKIVRYVMLYSTPNVDRHKIEHTVRTYSRFKNGNRLHVCMKVASKSVHSNGTTGFRISWRGQMWDQVNYMKPKPARSYTIIHLQT